jgi:hypothetical protein
MNAQEWVKDLKTFKYYFPKTVDEVHHMMSCAIEFLNLLAGTQDSIAARGYTDAIEAVNISRHGFKLKQSINPAFLTRVLYLIETEQQNVYTELLDSYQANPVFPLVHLSHLVTQRATRFRTMLPTLIGPIRVEIVLPAILSTRYNASNDPPSAKVPKKKQGVTLKSGGSPKEQGGKLWWREKPANDSDNWTIPSGKIYSDYFSDSDKGRNNKAKLENHQVGHHK